MIKKTILLITLLLLAGTAVSAQEDALTEETIQDIEVTAEDLQLEEPSLLPDNPFYFLKEWNRGIRSFFAFNKVKKLELENRFANERLFELKKLIEENKGENVVREAAEGYKKRIRRIQRAADKIESKGGIDSFLEKYTNHQILHQRVLEKLEQEVPENVFEKIKEARESHLERFKNVMLKLEERKNIPERIENAIRKRAGSKFKEFKNAEIMERIQDKMPDDIKERFQERKENILNNLKTRLEEASPEEKNRFQEYIEEIPGNREKQLRIRDSIKNKIEKTPNS